MSNSVPKPPLNRPVLGLWIVAAIIVLIAIVRYAGSIPWSAR